jgi:2'-5' RNA ligase
MRVFVGIKLDRTAVDNLAKVLKPFRKIAVPVKWTKTENIHLTLKFIGDVEQAAYQSIQQALSTDNYPVSEFLVRISGIGKFGRGQELNILWAGIEQSSPLEILFREIEGRLAGVGIPKETRPFKPHITLARNKKNIDVKPYLRLIEQHQDTFISESAVKGFQIFKSDLSPVGPTYTILKEITLE